MDIIATMMKITNVYNVKISQLCNTKLKSLIRQMSCGESYTDRHSLTPKAQTGQKLLIPHSSITSIPHYEAGLGTNGTPLFFQ